MGCIFPENKLEVLQIRGREWGGCWLGGEHPSLSLLFFLGGGGGIMWVQEWVAGFGIRGRPSTCLCHGSAAAWQTGQPPCEPHTFHR